MFEPKTWGSTSPHCKRLEQYKKYEDHLLINGVTNCSAGVGHVVDKDRDAVFNVSDEHHPIDFVRFFPFLVNKSEFNVQAIGDWSDAENQNTIEMKSKS